MVDYNGYTYTRTPSGDWQVNTEYGSIVGNTPADAAFKAAVTIENNNPGDAAAERYANGLRAIGTDPGSNSAVNQIYRTAERPTSIVTAANAGDTAIVPTSDPTPTTSNVDTPTSQTALSDSEQKTLENSNNYSNQITEAVEANKNPAEEATGTKVTVGPAKIIDDSDPPGYELRDNPLFEYSSYTYGISLHAISVDDYNKLVEKGEYYPGNVLIASAGRYNNTPGDNQFIRNKRFNEDFYFDNLEIETMIGFNAQTGETNAIDVKFAIIEPYGMTLMNRIIDVARDLKIDNYLDMPYMIQIDFFANNEDGSMLTPIPSMTKRIPIKLINLEMTAGVRGTEYKVEAMPYNHSAYDVSTQSTPVNLEIWASTVEGFFKSNLVDDFARTAMTNQQREKQATSVYYGPDGAPTYIPLTAFSNRTKGGGFDFTKDAYYVANSYGGALKNWFEELVVDNKIEFADEYDFVIDKTIGEKQLEQGGTLSPNDTPMTPFTKTQAERRSNLTGEKSSTVNWNSKRYSINAGTTVKSVLSAVIRNSRYILDQIIDPEDYGDDIAKYLEAKKEKSKDPLMWFKIIPEIKLLGYDRVRKTFARRVTYHVIPYEVKNIKIDVGPQAKATKPVKVYNYIYTGKNRDIIDFKLDFNALYFTAFTAYRNQLMNLSGAAQNDTESNKTSNPKQYAGSDTDPNAVAPLIFKPIVGDQQARATAQGATSKAGAAADLYRSLMTDAQADQILVKLKIIGDPSFIKQDDVYYTPKISAERTSVATGNSYYTPNGSLCTDNRPVYVQLTFRVPIDLDEDTGHMKFDSRYEQSIFSGMYQVLHVVSTFAQGNFTQEVEMVRLFDQESYDYTNKGKKDKNVERIEGLPQVERAPDVPVQTDSSTPGPKTNDATPAEQSAPVPEVETAPTQDPSAKDLKQVANDPNTPTETVTQATEPQPQATLSSELTASRQILSTQATAKSTEATYDAAKAKFDAIEQQFSNSKDPFALIEDPTWRKEREDARLAYEAARAENKKAQAQYSASIQRMAVIRQSGS